MNTIEKVSKRSSIETIIKKVEKEKADELRIWMQNNNITAGIHIDEDTKRYYPFNNLASQIIGFCGSDNQGLDGIEAIYDEELKGKKGKEQQSKSAEKQRRAQLAVEPLFYPLENIGLLYVAQRVFFGKKLLVLQQRVDFGDASNLNSEVLGKRQRGGRNVATENALCFIRFRLYDFGYIVGGQRRHFKVEKTGVIFVVNAVIFNICAVQCGDEQLVYVPRAADRKMQGERLFLVFAERED